MQWVWAAWGCQKMPVHKFAIHNSPPVECLFPTQAMTTVHQTTSPQRSSRCRHLWDQPWWVHSSQFCGLPTGSFSKMNGTVRRQPVELVKSSFTRHHGNCFGQMVKSENAPIARWQIPVLLLATWRCLMAKIVSNSTIGTCVCVISWSILSYTCALENQSWRNPWCLCLRFMCAPNSSS